MVVSVGTHQREVTRAERGVPGGPRERCSDRRPPPTPRRLRRTSHRSHRRWAWTWTPTPACTGPSGSRARSRPDRGRWSPPTTRGWYVCHRVDLPEAAARGARLRSHAVDEGGGRAQAASRRTTNSWRRTWSTRTAPRYGRGSSHRRGITPNQVTWMSRSRSGWWPRRWFAVGVRWLDVVGAVLLYASFILDCNDGSLARYTGGTQSLRRLARHDRRPGQGVRASSPDVAIGGVRMHEPAVWGTGGWRQSCAQTVRHMVDTWYGALQDTATRALSGGAAGFPARHARASGRCRRSAERTQAARCGRGCQRRCETRAVVRRLRTGVTAPPRTGSNAVWCSRSAIGGC